MPGHRCDVCGQRIKSSKDNAKAWSCKLCDFDLCQACHNKKVRVFARRAGSFQGERQRESERV